MERLSLPRRNYQPLLEVNNEGEKEGSGPPLLLPPLPRDPLPTWVTLPLDAKLPMVPGPRDNVLLYTTNLGERKHHSTPELDFDLTDPLVQSLSNNYKLLNDPHLKPHLDTAEMRKKLRAGGFITGDGKVLCTLREYNEYRLYLRRVNLALDRKTKTPVQKSQHCKKVATSEHVVGRHVWEVKQRKENIQLRYEQDRARYQRLIAEDEERLEKLLETHKSRTTEKEIQIRQEQDRRQMVQRKRQDEENDKKMEMLQRCYEGDEWRRTQTEYRRREREQLKERKLAESWEERRRAQQQTLAQELRVRHAAGEVQRSRLALRERAMQQRRQRQQSVLAEMTKKQRDERNKLERECVQRIAQRLERRKNMRKAGKKGKKGGRPELKSNWNITQLLLQEYSDTEEAPPRSHGEHPHTQGETRHAVRDDEREMTPKEQEEMNSGTLSSLKVKGFLSDRGIPTAGRLTANMRQLIRQTQTSPVTQEDLERVRVAVKNYIVTKVILPAYTRFSAEVASKSSRSIRFSTVNTEHVFSPNDDHYSPEEEDGRDTDMEGDDLERSTSKLAMTVDSLTNIRKQTALEEERATLGALASILCRLLDKLEHGEMSPRDAAKLAEAANDILSESLILTDRSNTSLSSQSSNTSMMAAEMVRTSMAEVQSELLNQYTADGLNAFSPLPPVGATSSELTGMSKFVAETALAMAVESLMSFTDGVISDQTSGKTKMVHSEGDLALQKSESSESISCTSDFILKVLTRVLERVRAEATAMTPPRQSDGKETRSDAQSPTSLYVQELLVKAVHSVQRAMASGPAQLLHTPPKSETSLFVMNTLQRIVQELQKSRTPSATSLFIEELLRKKTDETIASEPSLSWDDTFDIHQRRSSTPMTSIFIRDTLSKVLAEIEKETKSNSSATSLFAQEIVCSTLKKCESAVRQEMLPSRKLSELTAAILNSQQCNEDRNTERRKSGVEKELGCTQSLVELKSSSESAIECLAENLIRTTLEKAQQSLDHGTISAEDVVQVLSKISANSGQVAAIDVDGEAVPASNCSSQQAQSYVSAAIDKAIQEMSSLSQVRFGDLSTEGEFAFSVSEVSTLIESILPTAIQELSNGLIDESDIGDLETNLRYSLDHWDQGTRDDFAEYIRVDDSESDSDFESNEVLVKQSFTLPAEAESLPTSQNDFGIDRNSLARPSRDRDSDEEDEVLLQPFYKGEPLHVDPEVVCKALGAISVKNLEEMDDPAQALPRNSFRSLLCPDLTDLPGLDTSSAASLRSQLEQASKGSLPSQTRLRLAAASKKNSEASSYGSPGSSPQPSKTTVNRASLTVSSAPSMKTVDGPTRSPTLSRTVFKEKAASPMSSKKLLSERTTSGLINPGSTSQSKLSLKKSSTTKSPAAPSKASVSSVKKQISLFKQNSSNSISSKLLSGRPSSQSVINLGSTSQSTLSPKTSGTERRKSNESTKKSTRTSSDKVREDVTTAPSVTDSDTAVPPARQVERVVVEAVPAQQVTGAEIKVPEKKSSQRLPPESGVIEMTTSSKPPSKTRSTASCQSNTSNTSIASQRSVNMAPRPSSGFKKTSSGVGLTKNRSPTEVQAAGGSVGQVAPTHSEEDVSASGAGVGVDKVTDKKAGPHQDQQ